MKIPSLLLFLLWIALTLCGCQRPRFGSSTSQAPQDAVTRSMQGMTFTQARQSFQTSLRVQAAEHEPVPVPPPNLFRTVHYDSPVGPLAAYLSVSPQDGKKHPAIIWIFGGFSNGIDETAWEAATPDNDQSAGAFRRAGILMMYPSRRGGNDNPGFMEGFYGEVDDVLAAAEFLAKQDDVDPNRIYLGGHSTGGTVALLAAACSNRFRAVFALGPVSDVTGYGSEALPFNTNDRKEVVMRAPIYWLDRVQHPTYVFEGADGGNIDSLREMAAASGNPRIHFHGIKGGTHFTIIAPLTELIAGKVVRDTGPAPNLVFTDEELDKLLGR